MGSRSIERFYDAWNDFLPSEDQIHETYSGSSVLIPELDIVGRLCFKKPLQNALHPGRHKDWFEVLYMDHGQVDWWVEDSSYDFSAGQVLIISPNELHGAACAVMQPCEHYWLRFRIPAGGLVSGLSEEQQRRLLDFYQHLPVRMFQCADAVKRDFQRLIAAHRERTEFSEVIARCALLNILCAIACESRHAAPSTSVPTLSPQIQNVLRKLQDRLDNPPTVKEMAKLAQLSEATFRERFEAETGSPPHDYINIQRIREAKDLLRAGKSVTETAFALGFSSSQYFATVFKKRNGVSPSAYLELLAKPHRDMFADEAH